MARRKTGYQRRTRSARKPKGTKAKRRRSRLLVWAAASIPAAIVTGFFVFVSRHQDSLQRHGGTSSKLVGGQALYAEHCAACHGADLEGQPNWKEPLPDGRYPAPPHDESGHTWHHGDEYLFAVTKDGGQETAPPGFLSGMPGFGGALSDDEIWSILEFIKGSWPKEIRDRQRRAR